MGLDSFFYVQAAISDLDHAIWPIGYSLFLRLIHFFSHSPLVLVWIQYFLLVAANGWLFFTLVYFWELTKLIKGILFAFLFLNPLFFYICNFILSDALFLTLSMAWMTLLIWIIRFPKPYMIGVHALLLLITFSVRYNALYYPAVATIAFLIAPLRLWAKILGIILQGMGIGLFMLFISNQTFKATGVRVFTPFTGWKMANNALYMYGHIYRSDNEPMPIPFVGLDSVVRNYFDSVKVDDLSDYNGFTGGSFYMFENHSPLITYMNSQLENKGDFLALERSAPVATLYYDYGKYLIKKHPFTFYRYFVGPDIVRYTYPPMEIFASFSVFSLRRGEPGFTRPAAQWFGLKTLGAKSFSLNLRTILLSPAPLFVCLTHLLFLMSLLGYAFFGGIKKAGSAFNKSLLVVVSYCAADFFFSVTASSMVLRYLLFVTVVKFSFSLVCIDYIYKADKSP